jgi:CO/xanthine dehydrogenase Mo-binding subunit
VAVAAAEDLATRCRWSAESIEILPKDIPEYLRDNVTRSLPVMDGMPVEQAVPECESPIDSAMSHAASYYRPFQMHASIGPSAAVAQFANGLLTVFSHSQGVELLKRALASVLDLDTSQVHVIHAEGAGCYGHNGADDVALDAALLAMAAEPDPVSVKWTRADEHGYEPYGPAAVMDLRADLDSERQIVSWRHESFSFSHAGRPRPTPGYSNLQSSWWRERAMQPAPRQPAVFPEAGIHRNLQPIYQFPDQQLVKHFVADSPLRTSSLRSLGAFANVFAIESFMDELADLADEDCFEFRLRHLKDDRARGVLELLRQRLPALPDREGAGRGIALARYKNRQTWCAIAVDVEVGDDAGVSLCNAYIAADAGLVIDPDGVVNQLEGGFIQAASWSLQEEVLWDEQGVTSRDWQSYPILTFSEVPQIETWLRPSRDRALGVGEASTGPTPAAIANAIFSASGIRVREIPFTPDRLRSAASRVS